MGIVGGIFKKLTNMANYFLPKKKLRVSLYPGNQLHPSGNTKILYKYLKNQGFDCKYILGETKNREFSSLFRLSTIYYILTSKTIFLDGYDDFGKIGVTTKLQNIIQTWHATPIKEIGPYNRDYTFVCSSSKKVGKRFEKIFKCPFKVTGYPRNDVFFDEKLRDMNYQEKFHLNKYHKVILYAPTFRDKGANNPFSDKFLKEFNDFLRKKNYLFVIRKHPGEKHLAVKNHSNILNEFDKIPDIHEFMVHCDMLITDYSGIFIDFMILNRPIIFYPYDYEHYVNSCRKLHYEYYEELPGPFAKKEYDLYEIIKNIGDIFNDSNYKNRYKKFLEEFIEVKKNASKKVCDAAIKDLIGAVINKNDAKKDLLEKILEKSCFNRLPEYIIKIDEIISK